MSTYLGEFEQLVLFAILSLRDNAYGVTIREEIHSRTGVDAAAGAVYTTLGRLEARGFVSSRIGEPTPERAGRRRKYYTLKPAGATALLRTYSVVRQMADGLLPELGGLASGVATSDSN